MCTSPVDHTGYQIDSEGNRDLSEGSLNVNVSCNASAGYEGNARAEDCHTSGEYRLSGCNPIVCVRPDDHTGYEVSETNLDLSKGSLNVSAVCNTSAGYEGKATTTPCIAGGQPYMLGGCKPKPDHKFLRMKVAIGVLAAVLAGIIFLNVWLCCRRKRAAHKAATRELTSGLLDLVTPETRNRHSFPRESSDCESGGWGPELSHVVDFSSSGAVIPFSELSIGAKIGMGSSGKSFNNILDF